MNIDLIQIIGTNAVGLLFLLSCPHLEECSKVVSIIAIAAFLFLLWLVIFKVAKMNQEIEAYKYDVEHLEETISYLLHEKNKNK